MLWRYRRFFEARTWRRESMNRLEIIRRISDALPPAPPEVLVPVGDDCAVLRLGGRIWVVASDMLVSGKHFEDWATPEVAGYKAVAVNVSDVAAMGGTPRFISPPAGRRTGATLRCMRGVMEACEFGVYPLRGDTTPRAPLRWTWRYSGSSTRRQSCARARERDLLAVTGELGASAAGLLA